MGTNEIIDSGFFRAVILYYVEYYCIYHYLDKERLIYTMCNSDEEKDIATRAEIDKIKKKIRKAGYEFLSMDFIQRCDNKYPVDYSKEENKYGYWENYFHEFFTKELEGSLTYFTEAQSKIDKLPENPLAKDVDEETLLALDIISSESRNVPFLIECEEEIMNQIEADIENYKETDNWDFDLSFYEGYVKQSDILKLLFKLCKLLVLLKRLKMFESYIGLKSEEYIRNPFKEKLEKYGFFNLPLVKQIPVVKHSGMIDFIRSNKIPYIIAFLDYLGFIKHLGKEHFPTKYKLNLELSKWLNSNERTIKGNISSLLLNSTEDKNRYTAYRYKDLVEKDYKKLK